MYFFNPLLPALLQKESDGSGGGTGVSSLNGKTGAVYVAGRVKLDQAPLYYPDKKAKQAIYSLLSDSTKKVECRYSYTALQTIAEINDQIEGHFIRTVYDFAGGNITAVTTTVITEFSILI